MKNYILSILVILSGTLTPVAQAAFPPQITQVSPTYAFTNTDYNFVMKITGHGFVNGSTAKFSYGSPGFIAPTVISTAFTSSTELRVEVEIPALIETGFYDLTVTTPDGFTVLTLEDALELKAKADSANFYPVIKSYNPPSAPTNSTRNIIILGEYFAGTSPLVRLISTGSDGGFYDLMSSRLNHTEVHATVPAGIPVGEYQLLVRNTDYSVNQFIATQLFTIEPAPEPTPTPSPTPSPEPSPEPSDPTPNEETVGEVPSTHNPSTVIPQPKAAPAYFPNASAYDYRAGFIGQSGNVAVGQDGALTHVMQAHRGQDISMWITFKNLSNRQWWYKETRDPDDIHEVRLGLTKDSTSQFAHSDWISINRLGSISTNTVPGQNATLNFRLHIPENIAPGAYKLSTGLVAEWVKWMYDDVHWEIRVV